MILNNILFISEQTLKNECSYINENIDNKLLTDSIKDATIHELMPLIGSDLTKQLQQEISGNTLTAANISLLDFYIIPYLIKAATVRALPKIHYQPRNGGISKLVGDTFQPVELNELEYIVNSIRNDAQDKAKLLIDYLKANEVSYPLYAIPTSNKDTIYPNKNHSYNSGIYIPKC